MRLVGLRLRQFRRFDEAVFTFDPRLNILVGPNEAGKSTLRHAILTALFVNPATTSKKVAEWRPWGSESLGSIALEFEIDGRRFEVRKDFERRRVELRDLLHGLTWEAARAQEAVTRALGLSTEGLYRATAMIEQAEIATLKIGSADIGQRLSRIVQAGPGDAEAGAVLKRLDREIGELERGLDRPVKNPGTIRGLQQEVEGLEGQLAELQQRLARLDQQTEELRRIRVEAEAAARDLRDKEALLRDNQGFLQLEAQLVPLRERERQLGERIKAIEQGFARLSALARGLEGLQAQGVPDDDAIARLHAAQGALHQQRREVKRQEEAIHTEEDRIEALSTSPPESAWLRSALPGGLVLGLTGILAGVAGALRAIPGLLVLGSLLIAIGLAIIFAGRRQARRRSALRLEREAAVLRLEQARGNLDAAAEVLAQQEAALAAALAATGSSSVEEAAARHGRLRALLQERTAALSQVEAHLGGETIEGLREELDRARADIVRGETALARPETQSKRLTQLQVQQLEHDVQDLTQRVHRLQARREHLERETAEGAPDYEALSGLQERLADRQDALEAARRKDRVYRAVREGLQRARDQTLIPARRLVEERAGEYLSLLTLGAYDRVQIEEPPLRVMVWVPAAGAWMEPAEPALSRGTADQIYLAVRLALVEVLTDEGRHPPLLLDDPFGTFDPERLRAAMRLLRRVSETNQVLLFTCRSEYEPFADRVVSVVESARPPDLPGPLWQPPPQTH